MAHAFPMVSWATAATLYEVNIRQYTEAGNFDSFIPHLPRLQQMGIDILWLMPITPISVAKRQGSLGSYYACSSYVAINPEFGDMASFQQLVQAAHALGMKVIIDWVANHTGCDHEWTIHHPNFYQQDAAGNFTERNGWKDVIDLNYQQTAMREAMIAAMQFWLVNANIDGFRCDMAHLVPLDFWVQARTACDAIKPCFWLAECDDANYHQVFDVSYAWQWMHKTEAVAQQKATVHEMYEVLHGYQHYTHQSKKLLFTTNHDENSWNGSEYEKYGAAAKAWAVLTCTWAQSMPLVYSGQETANSKRLQFFDKDLIPWQQPLPLQHFYSKLLHLHKTAVVQQGETFLLPTPHAGVAAYIRKHQEAVLLVLLNFSGDARIKIQVQHEWLQGSFQQLFSEIDYSLVPNTWFELQAHEYLVYYKKG